MFKVTGYDADGIEAAIIPRPCGGCGQSLLSVYLHLKTVIGTDGMLEGIEATARSFACCHYEAPAPLGAELLAQVIEHVNTCPNHGRPGDHYHIRICRHPNASITPTKSFWVATCPDCSAMATSYFGTPVLPPSVIDPVLPHKPGETS